MHKSPLRSSPRPPPWQLSPSWYIHCPSSVHVQTIPVWPLLALPLNHPTWASAVLLHPDPVQGGAQHFNLLSLPQSSKLYNLAAPITVFYTFPLTAKGYFPFYRGVSVCGSRYSRWNWHRPTNENIKEALMNWCQRRGCWGKGYMEGTAGRRKQS